MRAGALRFEENGVGGGKGSGCVIMCVLKGVQGEAGSRIRCMRAGCAIVCGRGQRGRLLACISFSVSHRGEKGPTKVGERRPRRLPTVRPSLGFTAVSFFTMSTPHRSLRRLPVRTHVRDVRTVVSHTIDPSSCLCEPGPVVSVNQFARNLANFGGGDTSMRFS